MIRDLGLDNLGLFEVVDEFCVGRENNGVEGVEVKSCSYGG